jgi:chromosome segregation protein
MDRDLAAQSATEMRAEVATLEERRRGAFAALQRIETMAAEVASRARALATQLQSAAAEKQERVQQNVDLAERLLALAEERAAAETRVIELQQESAAVRERLASLDGELRSARQSLDAARDRRAEIAAAIAKLESDAEYLRQTCVNEINAAPEQLLEDASLLTLHGEALAQETAACGELRTKLDAMGPVNMMALEEYNETAQRHEFLETQRKDLLDSIENTHSTIREIDLVSRQKFQEAFERINESFQVAFKKLFGGGSAFMRLTDEEQGAESGIDIIASPPGKKLQNVLLLSGGEKALTALSLLVGIFQYQPSPFCILDEVDAPLDEVNVDRFVDMMREMSTTTQFVLITHSKRTMSAAPVMYGVTMQEPGVSKVVSVRFNEAAQRATA